MAGNGNSVTYKIITVCIIPVLFFMATGIINNDKDARERDTKIKEELVVVTKEQQQVNQEILIALGEIKTDIKYILKNNETTKSGTRLGR